MADPMIDFNTSSLALCFCLCYKVFVIEKRNTPIWLAGRNEGLTKQDSTLEQESADFLLPDK